MATHRPRSPAVVRLSSIWPADRASVVTMPNFPPEWHGQVGGGLRDVRHRDVQQLPGTFPAMLAESRHHDAVDPVGEPFHLGQHRGGADEAVEPAFGCCYIS